MAKKKKNIIIYFSYGMFSKITYGISRRKKKKNIKPGKIRRNAPAQKKKPANSPMCKNASNEISEKITL